MSRMLTDAADLLAQVETVIQREGIECYWRMNGRFSGAFTPRHYRRAGGQGRHLQCQCRPRHLHGAARAAARGDRVGLLLWRHGGGTHRPASSGALLRRPAEGDAPRRRHACAPSATPRRSSARAGRLHRAHQQGPDRGARGGDRHQRLHRRRDADLEAPAGAGRQPHHRDRGTARGPGQEPDPEGPRRQRYQARALLLPAARPTTSA